MIHVLRFYKEDNNRWYVDLPDYLEQGGHKEALEMVAGADTWLDFLSNYTNEVILKVSKDVPLKEHLVQVEEGTYIAMSYNNKEYNHKLWLCSVTLFVLEEYPSIIYYEVL